MTTELGAWLRQQREERGWSRPGMARRLITAAIGQPERWDWRDYPGRDELIATCNTLRGKITL